MNIFWLWKIVLNAFCCLHVLWLAMKLRVNVVHICLHTSTFILGLNINICCYLFARTEPERHRNMVRMSNSRIRLEFIFSIVLFLLCWKCNWVIFWKGTNWHLKVP